MANQYRTLFNYIEIYRPTSGLDPIGCKTDCERPQDISFKVNEQKPSGQLQHLLPSNYKSNIKLDWTRKYIHCGKLSEVSLFKIFSFKDCFVILIIHMVSSQNKSLLGHSLNSICNCASQ